MNVINGIVLCMIVSALGAVMLGYDLFHADKGMFQMYAHNSEYWLKLKYNF